MVSLSKGEEDTEVDSGKGKEEGASCWWCCCCCCKTAIEWEEEVVGSSGSREEGSRVAPCADLDSVVVAPSMS